MRRQDTDNDLTELMPRILSRENMLTAWQAVKRNGGAPGIDRMTVETLPTWLRANWEQTKADLLARRYHHPAILPGQVADLQEKHY